MNDIRRHGAKGWSNTTLSAAIRKSSVIVRLTGDNFTVGAILSADDFRQWAANALADLDGTEEPVETEGAS